LDFTVVFINVLTNLMIFIQSFLSISNLRPHNIIWCHCSVGCRLGIFYDAVFDNRCDPVVKISCHCETEFCI